ANVAPTASITPPYMGAVRGQLVIFDFVASDPSSADAAGQFGYAIDWGDGNTQTVQGPVGGVWVTHLFTDAGMYDVRVIATDKDGGSGAPTHAIFTVDRANLQNSDLYVGGTTGNDQITLTKLASGSINVVVNGENVGTFTTGISSPDAGGVL